MDTKRELGTCAFDRALPASLIPSTITMNPQSEQQDEAVETAVVKLAPFNPTCLQAQRTAMTMFGFRTDDVLFDIGCGDGRFLLHAAQEVSSLRCVGIEIDETYVQRARKAIHDLDDKSITERIDIRHGDALQSLVHSPSGSLSIYEATTVFVYLLPKGLQVVRPLLEEVGRGHDKPGRVLRVVSYMFAIKGWEPKVVDRTTKGDCALYLYEQGVSFNVK